METVNQICTAAGLMGCAFYVASYFLVQMDLLDGNDISYVVLNLLGSILMLLSLTQAFNLGAALLQIVWIIISLAGIAKKYARRRRETFKVLT